MCYGFVMSAGILKRFGVSERDLIGRGGQSSVYALDGGRVLRVYGAQTNPAFAPALADFYRALVVPPLPFAIPRILETGSADGGSFAIEERLAGAPLRDAMSGLDPEARDSAARDFMQAAAALHCIRHPQTVFGEVLTADPVRADDWRDFLIAKGEARAATCAAWLTCDVPELDRALAVYRDVVAALPPPEPCLVHGDYYGANVLVAADGHVTAVIDFSHLTLIGDGRLDVVGAWHALEALGGVSPASRAWARTFTMDALGADADMAFAAYGGYLALLHAGARGEQPALYRWCVETLNGMAAG